MLWHFNKNQFMIPYFRVIKTFHILLPIQAALFLFLYYLLNIIEPTKCTVLSINLELLRYTGVSRNICMCYWLVLYFNFFFFFYRASQTSSENQWYSHVWYLNSETNKSEVPRLNNLPTWAGEKVVFFFLHVMWHDIKRKVRRKETAR